MKIPFFKKRFLIPVTFNSDVIVRVTMSAIKDGCVSYDGRMVLKYLDKKFNASLNYDRNGWLKSIEFKNEQDLLWFKLKV